MSKFEGTPGPWGVTHVVKGHNPGIDSYLNGKPVKTVVLWASEKEWAGIVNTGEEQLANARLIAAAPELLEALQYGIKSIADKYEAECQQVDWYNNNMPNVGQSLPYQSRPTKPEFLNMAQSAINKALGHE